jgi:hypothetical protein
MAKEFDFAGIGSIDIEDENFIPIEELERTDDGGYKEVVSEEKEKPTETQEKKDEKTPPEAEAKPEKKDEEEAGESRQTDDNDNRDGEGTDEKGSPNTVSPIALALMDLKKVGALTTLDDDILKEAKDAEDIKNIIRKEVENLRSEDQKRLAEAKNSDMEPNAIQFFESQIKQFDEFDENVLDEEGDNGDNARRYLLQYQYKLKHYSDEDIKDLVEKSFDSGREKDDAKKALKFIRETFKQGYQDAIANAKEQQERRLEAEKKHVEEIRKNIMNDESYLKTLDVDKETREKIFDYMGKPQYDMLDQDGKVIRDGKGNVVKMSALTKFCREHLDEANKILATWLVLTEEGKDVTKLFRGPVNEEKKKINRQLEDNLINSTRRKPDGSFDGGEGVSAKFITDDELDKYMPA